MNGKILFIVSNQPDNLGDIIQNRNIIMIFQQLGDIIVDDHYLEERHWKAFGLSQGQLLSRNKNLPNLRKLGDILKLIFSRGKPYDIILRVPTAREYKHTFKNIVHELARLLIHIVLRLKSIQIYQFGMTCNPSKLYGILLHIERIQSRLHSIYSVRDITVYEQLKALGFHNLFYCPDVFYWDAPKKIRTDTSEKKAEAHNGLISLRRHIPNHPDKSGYERKLIEKVTAIIDSLPNDTRITFSYQVPEDYEINRSLFKKFKHKRVCEFIEHCLDQYSAENLYRKCDLIISNRQHCLLYGAKLGIPVLALTDTRFHWKLRGALYDLGMPELLLDIHDDNQRILNKCHAMLKEKKLFSKKLISATRKKREEAVKFLQEQLWSQIRGDLDEPKQNKD